MEEGAVFNVVKGSVFSVASGKDKETYQGGSKTSTIPNPSNITNHP
jgi:hypothetical protein